MKIPLLISFGAVLGALSRYYLGLYFTKIFPHSFPIGTFIINLSGCFFMGLFMGLALERVPSVNPEARFFFATGFLGSYTTFSTFGFESVHLLRSENYLYFALYALGSCFGGIALTLLGAFSSKGIK